MKKVVLLVGMLVALPAMSAPPLQVMFANPEPELCRFIYIPTLMPVFERPLIDVETLAIVPDVYQLQFGNKRNRNSRTMAVVTGREAANLILLEFMIQIGGLDLTPADFRDVFTGEFDCTNDRLFSLL